MGLSKVMTKPKFPSFLQLSLHARIMALSVLTTAGLLVVGAIFLWSQSQLAGAFSRLEQSAGLSRMVSDLSDYSASMQRIQKSYMSAPSVLAHEEFTEALGNARAIVEQIASKSITMDLKAEINDVLDTFDGTTGAFASLNQIQRTIGYTPDQGLVAVLDQTAGSVQKELTGQKNFRVEPDLEKVAHAILSVQLAEKKFIINKDDVALGQFEVAFDQYRNLLDEATLPDSIKASVKTDMISYRETFEAYTAAVSQRAKAAELLEFLFDLVPPQIEALNEASRTNEAEAQQTLNTVRSLSSTVMGAIIVGLLIVLTVFGIAIGRSIAVPMKRMQGAMESLAGGHCDIELPRTDGKSEMAAMARAIAVFRDNAIERAKLAEDQDRESAARDARVARLERLIAGFEATVDRALQSLDSATGELVQVSNAVEHAADDVANQASSASNAARTASENVHAAAAASEELAASINEISAQASRSTDVAKNALNSAQSTYRTIDQLSQGAIRIGEVMGLIRDIAAQTNLLALNATIEAARAGEAGRGFAVVAAEVKQLADETAKATGDIEAQVNAIQGSTSNAMKSIEEVTGIISEMEKLAGSVASSVLQQDEAVHGIARSVAEASTQSQQGSQFMKGAADASQHSKATGADVDRLAASLTEQAGLIRTEVVQFLSEVRAA